VGLLDHAPIWYLEGDRVHTVSRADFRRMVEEGGIGPDVMVVDTTLTTLRELREGGLERPASETWHGKAFFKAHATG
jgi:hypothetical protein